MYLKRLMIFGGAFNKYGKFWYVSIYNQFSYYKLANIDYHLNFITSGMKNVI